ncbi:DUF5995 family protein [Actinomycetospora termitidis]|uniref:DUF5995 family protein n=1 Tax=Actinomycetospora termitidis TaxID=3053470 RepID=A0ABT7M858_9PSEU|nr:DUF5995 family protein [Actinomycetospora sp. Odt1-22]MDL5156864.1 DUF5995 family protein [Actinomycetospora sp. Odt1-22]
MDRRAFLAAGAACLVAADVAVAARLGSTPPAVGGPRDPARRAALARAAAPTPVRIDDVVDQLAAIRDVAAAEPGRPNGIWCFSTLYHRITVGVRDGLSGTPDADARFVALLDVEFAKLYIDAVRCYAADPRTCPASWRVLFDRRDDPTIPAVHFAAAGVNAHINFDLAFALLHTWPLVDAGDDLDRTRAAYLTVNQVFATNMNRLRTTFDAPLTRWGTRADHAGDLLGTLLVRTTRAEAWSVGVDLWAHRHDPRALAARRAGLDARTAALGLAVLRSPLLVA